MKTNIKLLFLFLSLGLYPLQTITMEVEPTEEPTTEETDSTPDEPTDTTDPGAIEEENNNNNNGSSDTDNPNQVNNDPTQKIDNTTTDGTQDGADFDLDDDSDQSTDTSTTSNLTEDEQAQIEYSNNIITSIADGYGDESIDDQITKLNLLRTDSFWEGDLQSLKENLQSMDFASLDEGTKQFVNDFQLLDTETLTFDELKTEKQKFARQQAYEEANAGDDNFDDLFASDTVDVPEEEVTVKETTNTTSNGSLNNSAKLDLIERFADALDNGTPLWKALLEFIKNIFTDLGDALSDAFNNLSKSVNDSLSQAKGTTQFAQGIEWSDFYDTVDSEFDEPSEKYGFTQLATDAIGSSS